MDMDDLWWQTTRTTEPTIERIAQGLSVVDRWNGRSLRPWTTLQHVLAAEVVADASDPELRLALMFHDAEDMIFNDVPHPAKIPEQQAVEEEARRWLWERAFRLPYPGPLTWAKVRPIDDALAVAEAHVLMPPAFRDWGELQPSVADVVLSLLDMTPREAVFAFVEMATELRKAPKFRALEGRV